MTKTILLFHHEFCRHKVNFDLTLYYTAVTIINDSNEIFMVTAVYI